MEAHKHFEDATLVWRSRKFTRKPDDFRPSYQVIRIEKESANISDALRLQEHVARRSVSFLSLADILQN